MGVKKVSMTAAQRLGVVAVIRANRFNNETDAAMFSELLKAVRLAPEVARRVSTPVPGQPGMSIFEPDELARIQPEDIEMESFAVAKLDDLLREYCTKNGISAEDAEWFVPLRRSLQG